MVRNVEEIDFEFISSAFLNRQAGIMLKLLNMIYPQTMSSFFIAPEQSGQAKKTACRELGKQKCYLKKTRSAQTLFEEAARERLAMSGEFIQTQNLWVFLAGFTQDFRS